MSIPSQSFPQESVALKRDKLIFESPRQKDDNILLSSASGSGSKTLE